MIRYMIGHRGASGSEPENTLLSFRKAFEQGANAVELDVRCSADGELVVIHDPTLDRTTNGTGSVERMCLKELSALDAGKGQRIPTLDEVLGLAKAAQGTLFIEIKAPGIEEALISTLKRRKAEDEVVVFGIPDSVAKVRALEPSIASTFPGRFRIGIPDPSTERIREMHRQGLVAIHGDIDDEGEMSALIDMGIDGIITNFPSRLRKVVDRKVRRGGDETHI